jgi:hypothetical protein
MTPYKEKTKTPSKNLIKAQNLNFKLRLNSFKPEISQQGKSTREYLNTNGDSFFFRLKSKGSIIQKKEQGLNIITSRTSVVGREEMLEYFSSLKSDLTISPRLNKIKRASTWRDKFTLGEYQTIIVIS